MIVQRRLISKWQLGVDTLSRVGSLRPRDSPGPGRLIRIITKGNCFPITKSSAKCNIANRSILLRVLDACLHALTCCHTFLGRYVLPDASRAVKSTKASVFCDGSIWAKFDLRHPAGIAPLLKGSANHRYQQYFHVKRELQCKWRFRKSSDLHTAGPFPTVSCAVIPQWSRFDPTLLSGPNEDSTPLRARNMQSWFRKLRGRRLNEIEKNSVLLFVRDKDSSMTHHSSHSADQFTVLFGTNNRRPHRTILITTICHFTSRVRLYFRPTAVSFATAGKDEDTAVFKLRHNRMDWISRRTKLIEGWQKVLSPSHLFE
jgi:hypothetical protein